MLLVHITYCYLFVLLLNRSKVQIKEDIVTMKASKTELAWFDSRANMQQELSYRKQIARKLHKH